MGYRFQKCLSIQLCVLAPDHPDIANTYTRIGNVLAELGDHDKAMATFQKCLTIQRGTLGPV